MSKLKETFTKYDLGSLPNFLKYVKEELSEVIEFKESLFTRMYNISATLLEKSDKESPALNLQGFEVACGLVLLSEPQDDGNPSKDIAGQKLPSWRKIIFTLLDSDNDGKISKPDVIPLLSILVGCSFKPNDYDDDDDEFSYVNSTFPECGNGTLEFDAFEKVPLGIPITLYSVLVDVVKYIAGIVLTPSKQQLIEQQHQQQQQQKKDVSSSGIFGFFKKKEEPPEPQNENVKDDASMNNGEGNNDDKDKEVEVSSSAIAEDFSDSDEEEGEEGEEAARCAIKVVIKPKEEVAVNNISLSGHSFMKPPSATSSRRRGGGGSAMSTGAKLTGSSSSSLLQVSSSSSSSLLVDSGKIIEESNVEKREKNESGKQTGTELSSENSKNIVNDKKDDVDGDDDKEVEIDKTKNDLFDGDNPFDDVNDSGAKENLFDPFGNVSGGTESKEVLFNPFKEEVKNPSEHKDDSLNPFKEETDSLELKDNPLNPFKENENEKKTLDNNDNNNDENQNDFFSAANDVLALSKSSNAQSPPPPPPHTPLHIPEVNLYGTCENFFFSPANMDKYNEEEDEGGNDEDEDDDDDDDINDKDDKNDESNNKEIDGFVVIKKSEKGENSQDNSKEDQNDSKNSTVKYVLPNKKAKKSFSECMRCMEIGEYGNALDHAQDTLRTLPDNVHPKYPRMVISYLMAARILESIASSTKSANLKKLSLLGTWLASLPLHKTHRMACLLIASVYSDSAARAASALIPDWSQYTTQCYPNGGIYTLIHCRSCKSMCDASLPRCFVCGTSILYCCLTMNPIENAQYKKCKFCSGTFMSMLISSDECPLCGRKALFLATK